MAIEEPPKSPTLFPPRKSVELEDPGARELESSNDEEDVFTDAQDTLMSPTSPVPITRVEKVDDEPSHGQVPGTEAYEKRTQDAVPDEIAIVPDGEKSMPSSRRGSGVPRPSSPIPKTVVEKVDPDVPSLGEKPGTLAHSKRKADAVPDSIVKASAGAGYQDSSADDEKPINTGSIPRTVVTRVDSQPSYGEVPGTDAYKNRLTDANPDIIEKKGDIPSHEIPRDSTSPIAADGGFGNPADHSEEDDSENEDDEPHPRNAEFKPEHAHEQILREDSDEGDEDDDDDDNDDDDDGFGDDFDDFEEGAEADDFGDFDDGFTQEESESEPPAKQPVASVIPSFPVLDFSTHKSLDDILAATDPHLSALFPATADTPSSEPPPMPDSTSQFLTERSHALWTQLVAPPPLQPPNWVRSRIRRLFLVSLGVPVDLDEILPKSKQKKLILPYTSTTSGSAPKGSAAQLRAEGDGASDSAQSHSGSKPPRRSGVGRRKGPAPPPKFDMQEIRTLFATTDEALEGMGMDELKAHVAKLEELVERGKEVLQYWVMQKEAAVGEKEAFDGVIENLVRHARKVRK